MKKLLMIAGVAVLISTLGCYNDKYDKLYVTPPNTVCDTTAMSFTNNILPILNANCNIAGGCHNTSGKSVSQFDFTTYPDVKTEATIDIMVNDINGTPSSRHHAMPLNLPKISQCDINQITAWINQGALDN